MITIFVLLGLSFLVGGVGAIVDGWPYLVLERGFTQVIIGTVAATGGVILLALAWVLVELRRVRTALRAMSLLSAVGLQGEPAPPAVVEARAPAFPEPPPSESRLPGLGTVAAGAGLAAAGGALATAMAERGIARHEDQQSTVEVIPPTRDEPEPEAPEPVATVMFDGELVDVAATKEAGDEVLSHSGREPAADELPPQHEAEPAPIAAESQRDNAPEDDIFAAIAAEHALPEERDHEIPAEEREPEPQVEPAPSFEPVPAVEPVEAPPVAAPEPRRSWWPRFGAGRTSEASSEREGGEADDLASLRQHLTLGPQPPLQPVEPNDMAEQQHEAEPAAPEAWAPPAAFGRREPTFDEPSEQETPALEPEDETEAEDEPAAEAAQTEEPTAEAADEAVADEAETSATETPQPSEPPRPAASDEGVVGAYQVGDTHFTMYADGSIKARTPDGEYSFASMDELKTYLASEKSRIGS